MELDTGTDTMNGSHLEQMFLGKRARSDDNVLMTSYKENHPRGPVQSAPQVCLRRKFLAIASTAGVYQSDESEIKESTMYQPVCQDLLLSTRNIEQWSFGTANAFVADRSGFYDTTLYGDLIHMWRYDDNQRKLFISRTLLFTDRQVYLAVRRQLEEM